MSSPAAIRLHQQLVAGEVRQQPQLDLRIVGLQQHVPGLGNERGANLAAQFSANRECSADSDSPTIAARSPIRPC